MSYPENISYTHPSSPLYEAPADDGRDDPQRRAAVLGDIEAVVNGLGIIWDRYPDDSVDLDEAEAIRAALLDALAPFRGTFAYSRDRDARKLGEML